MKKINYDEFMKWKKKNFFDLPAKLGRRRMPSRKPRNPEEREALMRMDMERYKKWIDEGILVEVSPKKYIVIIK